MKKVLVIRLGAMGDVCMAAPLVHALQEHCDVQWLVGRHYQAIPACFSALRCPVIAADVAPASGDRPPFPEGLVRKLQEENFDALLDLSHWPEVSRLVNHLRDVPLRAATHDPVQDRLLGVNPKGVDLCAPFNCLVPVVEGMHQHAKWRRLVHQALQIDLALDWPMPRRSGPAVGGPLRVFLQPHASKPTKVWPLDRFVATIVALARTRRVICDINSGNRRELSRAIQLWGRLAAHGIAARLVLLDRSCRRLRAALELADLALGCDSGPMHFAALLGVPTVVIYGPYSAAEFGPPWRSVPVEPAVAGAPASAVGGVQVLGALRDWLPAVNDVGRRRRCA